VILFAYSTAMIAWHTRACILFARLFRKRVFISLLSFSPFPLRITVREHAPQTAGAVCVLNLLLVCRLRTYFFSFRLYEAMRPLHCRDVDRLRFEPAPLASQPVRRTQPSYHYLTSDNKTTSTRTNLTTLAYTRRKS
jgi:hypothetical protein